MTETDNSRGGGQEEEGERGEQCGLCLTKDSTQLLSPGWGGGEKRGEMEGGWGGGEKRKRRTRGEEK